MLQAKWRTFVQCSQNWFKLVNICY